MQLFKLRVCTTFENSPYPQSIYLDIDEAITAFNTDKVLALCGSTGNRQLIYN